MQYRTFGRTGWQVSDVGYGMWGMGELDPDLIQQLRTHRWDRAPTWWSQ